MTKPLRLGVAGLGVVGTSLVRLLQRQRAGLIVRTGREFAFLAYSARRKGDRGVDLGDALYFASAADLAASAEIDIFVELIGGADGVAFEAVIAALARGVPVVSPTRRCSRRMASSSRRSPTFRGRVCISKRRWRRHPVIKTLREESGRQRDSAGFRHSQRHLQLYPVPHGEREPAVRGLPRARLRGSATPKRIRRLTSAASTPRTSSPFWPRLLSGPRSTPGRFRSRALRRSPLPT